MDSPDPAPVPAPGGRRTGAPLRPGEQPVAWVRVWTSTPGRLPTVLAARTRDLALVTHDRLSLFTIGFFTRRPRRRVYDVTLTALQVTEMPKRFGRRLRVTSAAHPPMLLDIGSRAAANAFADDLLQRAPAGAPDPQGATPA